MLISEKTKYRLLELLFGVWSVPYFIGRPVPVDASTAQRRQAETIRETERRLRNEGHSRKEAMKLAKISCAPWARKT
jgi:hypothetical protein